MDAKEERIMVRMYQCHLGGHMKIASLMQSMQEIATIHAEELGFGFSELNKKDVYWVLSNMRVEFSEIPQWSDEILLKTWPSGCSRLVATREFVGTGENNRGLFKASSQWMILGRTSGRPRDLLKLNLGLPEDDGEKALSCRLRRLEPLQNYVQVGTLDVPYSSIDLNGHVNYTEYMRWGLDALRKSLRISDSVSSMQATYLAEVFEADQLELLVARDSEKHFGILIRRPKTNDVVFLMEACI